VTYSKRKSSHYAPNRRERAQDRGDVVQALGPPCTPFNPCTPGILPRSSGLCQFEGYSESTASRRPSNGTTTATNHVFSFIATSATSASATATVITASAAYSVCDYDNKGRFISGRSGSSGILDNEILTGKELRRVLGGLCSP